jgi:hypothetical protein
MRFTDCTSCGAVILIGDAWTVWRCAGCGALGRQAGQDSDPPQIAAPAPVQAGSEPSQDKVALVTSLIERAFEAYDRDHPE